MTKKIAVVTRDRQSEALRMAVGIILLDDVIDVYILDRKIESNEQTDLYMETINDLDMKAYSNIEGNTGTQFLATEEIARRLLEYDHVLAY